MTIEQKVLVSNTLGLHARASARLVNLANQFESRISLQRSDTQTHADAKSILSVMFLAATPGTELIIQANGADESAALAALVLLFENHFDETSHVF
jgi:phosphocarrier protein HPr